MMTEEKKAFYVQWILSNSGICLKLRSLVSQNCLFSAKNLASRQSALMLTSVFRSLKSGKWLPSLGSKRIKNCIQNHNALNNTSIKQKVVNSNIPTYMCQLCNLFVSFLFCKCIHNYSLQPVAFTSAFPILTQVNNTYEFNVFFVWTGNTELCSVFIHRVLSFDYSQWQTQSDLQHLF